MEGIHSSVPPEIITGKAVKVVADKKDFFILQFRTEVKENVREATHNQKGETEEEIPDSLKCPVCLTLFVDPISSICGHTFCKKCLKKWKKESETCPICKKKLEYQESSINISVRDLTQRYNTKNREEEEEEEEEEEQQQQSRDDNSSSSDSDSDQDEEVTTSRKSKKRKKSKSKQKQKRKDKQKTQKTQNTKKVKEVASPPIDTITTHYDYYLSGDLSKEITSPLVAYTIKVVPISLGAQDGESVDSNNNSNSRKFFSVIEIIDQILFRPPLTKTLLKQGLLRSEYIIGSNDAKSKIVDKLLSPLNNIYGFIASAPITEERQLECIFSSVEASKNNYRQKLEHFCKNLFKDKLYLDRVSWFGTSSVKELSEYEFKILESSEYQSELESGVEMESSLEPELPDTYTEEDLTIRKKLFVFEKICFLNYISEEQMKNFEENSLGQIYSTDYSLKKTMQIWVASCIYHKMMKESKAFGSTCSLRPKEPKSGDGWNDEDTMKILENHGCELIRSDDYTTTTTTTTTNMEAQVSGIVTKEVSIMQRNIGTILNNLESLTLLKVEDDTDHESESGYFDWLRTEMVKKHSKRETILISTLEKRKRYLGNHTSFDMIRTCKDIEKIPATTRVFSVLIVDRCHVLGLEEFSDLLSKFKSSLKHLYLCGSTLCIPETMGNPFHDVYTHGGVRLEVKMDRREMSQGIQREKIREYYPSIKSMVDSCKENYGSMYIIVQNKKEKDKLRERYSSLVTDIGLDSLITLADLTYEIPPRATTAIFLSEEQPGISSRVKMNMNQMAKCFSCASTKPTPVVIIGCKGYVDTVIRNQRSFRNSLLSIVIEEQGLSMM